MKADDELNLPRNMNAGILAHSSYLRYSRLSRLTHRRRNSTLVVRGIGNENYPPAED